MFESRLVWGGMDGSTRGQYVVSGRGPVCPAYIRGDSGLVECVLCTMDM